MALTLMNRSQPRPAPETAVELLLQRVQGEFRDMPGLNITVAQAARLFGIDADLCERLLGRLVSAGVLSRGPDGRVRRGDS